MLSQHMSIPFYSKYTICLMQTLGDSTWTSTVSELILRTVLKRYLSHILCRNPWGNSFSCTLEETLEDLGAEPPCNIWACCSSVDLLRSQENSITQGESGEKLVCLVVSNIFYFQPYLGEMIQFD